MVIRSYAKINLFLEIIRKRPDNYHNLNTLFERISLCDRIRIKNRTDNLIKITCNDPRVPRDESNLCFQAAKLLQDKFGITKGLDIAISKRIPVGAGLGGGSSNAASVLLALNELWGLNLSKARLAALAAHLGSDVPFFIYDTPFARGEGRGEKISPLNKLNKVKLWHILVVPETHVSTPLVYKKWDAFSRLTKPASNVKIIISKLAEKNPAFKPGLLFNSLEPVTLRLYSEVRRVREKLKRLGLRNILMSGSGGAFFAVVSSEKEAAASAKRLKKEEAPWRAFAVSTV